MIQNLVHCSNLTSSNYGVLLLEQLISPKKITTLPGGMLIMTMTIVKGEIFIFINILIMIQYSLLYFLLNHPSPIKVLQF